MYPIETLRHSYAHVLAAAIMRLFPGAQFGVGPVVENGFYYDMLLPAPLGAQDLPRVEAEMKKIIKKNLKFEKREMPIDEAVSFFQKNNQPFKVDLLNALKTKGTTSMSVEEEEIVGKKITAISVYKTGDFVDLCRGPHVSATKDLASEAFKLTKIAGAYWRGSEKNPMLTRVYGLAFSSKQELDQYLRMLEELEKRDHRKIGTKHDLFSFHDVAPGAPFWHPKGMIIIKELEKLWRQKHEAAGYRETSTPIMVKRAVFERSGHLAHYKENMFKVTTDDEEYYLKPMNCPESTYIYASTARSYRELPLRLSEIGRLHRAELSGVLSGLFRVRQLTMDDAHIYCAPEQIQKEISGVLRLIKEFYKIFNFQPNFFLATKPKESMGDPKLWEKAEKALEFSLRQNKLPFELKSGDGAFYGPKIDVHITDSLGRPWQMATVQLDFQMPERFGLEYADQKGKKSRPVMIHRAVFGSFERFIGILIEHYAGAFPLWLSPEQVWILPVGKGHARYAGSIYRELKQAGARIALKDENETVGKKIRNGETQKIPYLLIVGDKEVKSKSVAVRKRDKGDLGPVKFKQFLEQIKKEIERKR